MKLKNKGKVYPTPSSSSGEDYLSILKLLPAAIFALASALSLEDREVLAYMITRSLKTTTSTTNSSLISQDSCSKKRSSKKTAPNAAKLPPKTGVSSHKPPVFDCDCFDCYRSYWSRWNSSPNREPIHQVIEAFEDHLTNGEVQKPSKKNARPKRRDSNSKTAIPIPDASVVDLPGQAVDEVPVLESSTGEAPVFSDDVTSKESDVKEEKEESEVTEVTKEFPVAEDADVEEQTTAAATTTTTPTSNHKGLARKVLPDVLGLFNSRLWGLWNPNV